MPDEAVAKKLGRPLSAVLKRRHARGIPNPAPRRKFWTPEEMKLLGTRPDKEIAARLDCPIRTVTTKRVKLGIRAFLDTSADEPAPRFAFHTAHLKISRRSNIHPQSFR